MPSRGLARGLRALSGWVHQHQAAHAQLGAAVASCRHLAAAAHDPSLAPSTSAPTLPPTLRELQASLRAPRSVAVDAADHLSGLGVEVAAAGAAGDDQGAAAAAPSGASIDTTVVGQMLGVPRGASWTRGQLDTLRLLSRHNSGLPNLRGQTILAKVLSVDASRVIVDTGYNGVAELPRADVTIAHIYTEDGLPPPRSSTSEVLPGDVLRLRVDATYTPYGDMQLTAVREDTTAQRRLVWDELTRAMEGRKRVVGRVLNECQGGYAVGVAGFVALLPAAFAGTATVQRVGEAQEFEVVAMNRARQLITLRDPSLDLRGPRGGRR
ncbi:hypothetical protein HYH03_016395 [Edaphochlamys debaryana]|uniref:Uncharacterized protein n=1 Tax=Edaphochlamys debaryana TaxID=47281 RepID=A0A836BRN9_9CHLO|nr:hypothetical protein HYH03_016395 [Edaphochlamys debaryana]|eukprot:KAG2484828.1 hypothetical protein HYH03_016395 [Edaphochlamys debaryana]